VELDAEHSPNKLRRVASPLSRWAAEASTAAAAHADVLTVAQSDALFDELVTHDHDPLQSLHPLPDSLAAEADLCAFLDDELDMVSHLHSVEGEPDAVIGGADPCDPLTTDAPYVRQGPRRPLVLDDLTQAAHRELITDLRAHPQILIKVNIILRFLHHLETLGLDWHTLRGDTSELRPLELETQVNAAIDTKQVSPELRGLVNRSLNLRLRGETGIRARSAPNSQAHRNLIEQLRATATQIDLTLISSLLGCLEAQGKEWHVISQPLPHEHAKRPLALEAWINEAIQKHHIGSRSRAAVNRLFGFLIKSPNRNNCKLSEHTELIKEMSEKSLGMHKSKVMCFLFYLESIGSCWSHQIEQLPGAVDPKRPIRLEETVNFASSTAGHKVIDSETRTSLNTVFGFELKVSNSFTMKAVEHINLLNGINANLPRNKANKKIIRRFFIHLEREGKLFSEIEKTIHLDAKNPPSELEKMVNELIEYDHFTNGLRAALNRQFDVRLRGPTGRYTKPYENATS
jgi:hypothetical protein